MISCNGLHRFLHKLPTHLKPAVTVNALMIFRNHSCTAHTYKHTRTHNNDVHLDLLYNSSESNPIAAQISSSAKLTAVSLSHRTNHEKEGLHVKSKTPQNLTAATLRGENFKYSTIRKQPAEF